MYGGAYYFTIIIYAGRAHFVSPACSYILLIELVVTFESLNEYLDK
jgi:hypothetical protein